MHARSGPTNSTSPSDSLKLRAGLAVALALLGASSCTSGDKVATNAPPTTTPAGSAAPGSAPGSGASTTRVTAVPPGGADYTTTTRRVPGVPAVDIRTVDFKNFTYPADSCVEGDPNATPAPYNVVNGRKELGGSSYVTAGDRVVYGDINGGTEDAVVTFTCSTGVSSGTRNYAWLFTPDPTAPSKVLRFAHVEFDQTAIASDWSVNFWDASIATGGALTTRWGVATATDNPNFPTKMATMVQRWNGSALLPSAPVTIGERPPGM